MAYRRPAIEVIQDFQAAAAALALPTLPAVVVGPAFQIVDDANVGIYDASIPSVQSYSYVGLAAGAVVDLTNAPEDDAAANVHKGVGVKLDNLYLIKKASASTGDIQEDLNVFNDPTPSAFAGFDPDAEGAPAFYVEITGGTTGSNGRYLVLSKTDDNNLAMVSNFTEASGVVEYRVLEFRETEVIPEADFAAKGIAKDADSVDISPALTTSTDDLTVVEATVLLSWRALRADLASSLNAFTDLDSLEAEFGVGSIVPANIGPYGVNLALLNTTTEINLVGLDAGYYTDEEQAYQSAFEFLETTDMYTIAPTTHLAAVHQQLDSHVENLSASTVGRERIGVVNRQLVETEILVPPSGVGNITTGASPDGFIGAPNKIFTDATNGAFITDGVGVLDLLQVISYDVAAEGVERSVTQNIGDYLDATGKLRLGNAAFTGADSGLTVLYDDTNGSGNDQAYVISAVTSDELVAVSPSPALDEQPGLKRVWVSSLARALTPAAGDAVTQATRTFDFSTSGEVFTSADVGRLLHVEGVHANLVDRTYTIDTVPTEGGSTVTVVEEPGQDDTFAGGETVGVYDIVREVTPDFDFDFVVGLSRTWTILNGNFTDEDVGRTLRIAGSTANDADHVISVVVGPSQVITDNSTTPVNADFGGNPNVAGDVITIDVVSKATNATEDAFILGTLHQIASVDSNSQLTLVSDVSGGFAGSLENVEYRVLNNLSLNDQAAFLAGYASSFANRRLVHTWPDVLAVSVNGIATKVPGYYAGSVIAALVAGLPAQAGFTNLTVTGFVGRENSDDKFSDTQLDTIAGGGNFIFTQPVPDTALLIRHQLTTDLTTIFFQELSVTKNVDLIAKFFRALYRPFLGIYNITDTLLDLLKTRGEGGIQFLRDQRVARIGAPIRRGNLTRIEESATQPDTVEIDIDITVPLPLNNIKLTLLI